MLQPPLTVSSTARAIGVSPSTIVRLVRTGQLGFVRTSPRRIAIPQSEIDRYLTQRFVPARGDAASPSVPRLATLKASKR